MLGWIASFFIVWGLIIVGHKNRTGFLLCLVGSVLWAIKGSLIGEIDLMSISILLALIHLNNWKKWKDSP